MVLPNHLWHPLLRLSHRLCRVFVVLQLPGKVGVIGGHVEVTMPTEIEQNRLLLPCLFRLQCLVDRCAYCMPGLRRRNDPFSAREFHSGLEDGVLVIGLGLDDAFIVKQRHQRCHAVIAQPACMNTGWYEVMTERVHFHQWCHTDCISIVESIYTLGQARASHRFCSQEASLQPFSKCFANEGECYPRVIAASTHTPN